MKREIIIEKYGQGNAVIVLDQKNIVDLFIDPPVRSNFYPPNTFVEAKIQRKAHKKGGYFIKLPNALEGFLKSKINYREGEVVVLLAKVFFDKDKPQTFTDKLRIVSKYFILKIGNMGYSFSNKLPKKFNKEKLIPILEAQIKNHDNVFVICRSRIGDIGIEQFNNELEKILQHRNLIKEVSIKKIYFDGLARAVALDKYEVERHQITEEEGIFERLGLWDQINSLRKKKYIIGNGAYLIIDKTSSFFAIDVNSGKDLKIDAKELNLLACLEIFRLAKILGFGGKIIIDFLPCSKIVKREIYDLILSSFSNDNQRNKIWGWTKGGAFELEREREKTPLKLLIPNK